MGRALNIAGRDATVQMWGAIYQILLKRIDPAFDLEKTQMIINEGNKERLYKIINDQLGLRQVLVSLQIRLEECIGGVTRETANNKVEMMLKSYKINPAVIKHYIEYRKNSRVTDAS